VKYLRRFAYERLSRLWPVHKANGRWVNLMAKLLQIGAYPDLRRKKMGNYSIFLDPGDPNDRFYFFDIA